MPSTTQSLSSEREVAIALLLTRYLIEKTVSVDKDVLYFLLRCHGAAQGLGCLAHNSCAMMAKEHKLDPQI